MEPEARYEIGKERLYLYAPAAYILMKVVFQAHVSPEALRAAIGKAAARQATLCSRVEQDRDGAAYFVPCEPVPAHITVVKPEEALQAVMQREIRTPFDVEHGGWMRHYFAEENGRDVWLLACHHMAGDGLSVLFFIRDVQTALGDLPLQWERQPFCLCQSASLGGKLPAPMRWGIHAINRQWEKDGRIFRPEDRERMTGAYWQGRMLSMKHTTVENGLLESVLAACRSHGVTLTAAWLAAVMTTDGNATDAGVAVSVRPKNFDGMANWATGISVRYTPKSGDFWRAARDIRRLMLKKQGNVDQRNFLLNFLRELSPTLIDATYFSAFDGLENKAAGRVRDMFGYNGGSKGCSVTNLLRAPLVAGMIERIEFYPPMVPNAKRLFGLVTVEDKLEFTLQSFEPEEDTIRFLDAALDRIVREL